MWLDKAFSFEAFERLCSLDCNDSRVLHSQIARGSVANNLRNHSQQRWLTFIRIHAQGVVACDFFVVVTATFRTLYVLVIMEIGYS